MMIDKEECACGHGDDCQCVHCCRWHGKSTTTPRLTQVPTENWHNDAVQFPRFLAAFGRHVTLEPEQLGVLCEAEDISEEEWISILERASVAWERIKKHYYLDG